jgi:type I restriction enzyme M protein
MRSGAPAYGKTSPLKSDDFEGFVRAFGQDPLGRATRKDEGATGRFRRFTREEIIARGDNLDIIWLKDTTGDPEDGLETPEDIATAIELHLASSLVEVRALVEELGIDVIAPAVGEAAE